MSRCFLVATVVIAAVLLPAPTNAGRLELKNEISGVYSIWKTKLAVRCWSNEDNLGWDVLKPKESRIWKFTTMNMWPFKKTAFRCQFLSGFGTTNEDVVRVFSVDGTFRKECGVEGNECIWVAKRDGFYLRKIVKDKDDHKEFIDVLKSQWVWKWHPFDSSKWGRVCKFLVSDGFLEEKSIVEPLEASKIDLLVVHSENYLNSLKSSATVARITEVPPVAFFPNFLVQQKVLYPFRKQVGGTILAAKLAKERGWAINVGGGFHHCTAERGGGFCAFADISLCIHFAFLRLEISRVMIIDLDAHQGNGHETDLGDDSRVYILDMYNPEIYPFDYGARRFIDQKVEVKSGTTTDEYLRKLDKALEAASRNFEPELVIYNAGTDILDGDPLGLLKISPEGITSRDEKVFKFARDKEIPLVMLTSGGYMKSSARVIADSIENLSRKGLIQTRPDSASA